MTPIRIALVVFAATILELSGCGGAGGGGSLASVGNNGGIGGTGITSSGTIDGFGSIFVNGIEFETDASEVSLDGLSGSADSLRLGMVVTVRGTVNEDGKTGVADSVSYKDDIQGPISTISISQDNDALLITVLGVQIIAERKATVFDGVSFDTLAVNDVIEVSGFVESELQLRATRIEKKSAVDPGTSDVTLKGVVTGLTGTQFSLGSNLVDFSNADLSGINGGTLSEGLHVEVYGRLANNLILADRIEQDDDFTDDLTDQEELSVQGVITSYQDAANFIVNGVVVDASNAALEPTDLILANGLVVEVEGVWNGLKLVAQEVESRRGSIELDARVAAIDVDARTISLQYFSGTVTVQMTSTTLLKDDTERANPFALRDITSGDFLEVEAIMVGNDLVASRIRRDQPDDDVIQAPVERFNAGTSITLLGITFSTTGAEFEDARDREINTGQFFSTLQIGDLVKVTDEGLADGIADEVEFETEEGVDDEDFEDESDDQCDDPNADSDDDCESDDEDCDANNAIANDDCDSEDEDHEDHEDDEDDEDDDDEDEDEEDEEDDSDDDEDEEEEDD